MPSTYSPNLRIELIANGEQSGTWGTTTNVNLGTLIEDAIAGYVSVSVTSANQALTALDGAADQSRNMVLNLTTTTSANFNVYIPPAEKFYVVRNDSAYNATIFCSTVLGNTTAAGLGVTVLANSTTIIFSDGTNVRVAIDSFSGSSLVAANLTVNGNTTLGDVVGDTVTVNGATTFVNAAPTLTPLTASQAVFTNGSKTLVSNAITGTGNVVMSTSPTLVAPILGTPASGVVTNLTGTASININGTVGATTPAAGTFTDLTVNTSGVISVNTSGNALRITQTGAGNALLVEDSANPDSTPFVVDADGRLLQGITSSITGSGVQFTGGNTDLLRAAAQHNLNFYRANTSLTSPTVVSNAQSIGQLTFNGYDGSAYVESARIRAEVDGTPGTNDMPGRLVFSTTADGASTPTERMRIDSSGNVGIGTSSPTVRLDVRGDSPTLLVRATNANSVATLQLGGQDNSSNNALSSISSGSDAPASTTSYLAFGTRSSAGGNPIERLRINSSGNVGIGTTSPSTKLQVNGSSTFLGSGGASVTWGDTTALGFLSFDGSGNPVVRANTGLPLVFQTNGANERMRIDSSGNVGIGTSSPGSALNVKGTLRLSGATSGYVGFAPAAAAGSTTYTLPSTDGTSGQFLSTNGSGTLSWGSGGGASISQGNSNVTVTDAGTGKIEFNVDAVEVADFTTAAIVFNESGANQDFRVEGDTEENLFVVDASADKVGIGTNAPAVLAHVQSTTATTNAVTQVLRLDSQSSGTPANGIGVGMQFSTETAAGNTEIGATIEAITTDVTATSEDFDLSFKTMAAGAAAAERARIKSTGDFQFNSGYGSVATAYGCRAWVNFNGTGTVAIREDGNVSSITDNGTGDYTVNFTTAMSDANYNSVAMGRHYAGVSDAGFIVCFQNGSTDGTTGRTTSSLRVSSHAQTSALTDSPCVTVSIFR